MTEDYRFIERRNEGLVILTHPQYKTEPWTVAKVRKKHICAVSGKPIKVGEECYRPVTNGYNRMHRIKRDIIDKFQ